MVMRVSNSGEWQLRQCPNTACLTTTLRVRRDPREHEIWWVGRLDYNATWRIAATEPCCPLCGSDLDVGMGVKQNVG
jgi:hypothetical protein